MSAKNVLPMKRRQLQARLGVWPEEAEQHACLLPLAGRVGAGSMALVGRLGSPSAVLAWPLVRC